jgi:hypothetical protein
MEGESKVVLAKAKVADLLSLDVHRIQVWGEREHAPSKEGASGKAKESAAETGGGQHSAHHRVDHSPRVDPASDDAGEQVPAQFIRQLLHNGGFEGRGQQQSWRTFSSDEDTSAAGFSVSQPVEVTASAAAAAGSVFGLKNDPALGVPIGDSSTDRIEFNTSIVHSGKRSLRLPVPEKCSSREVSDRTEGQRFVEYFDLGDDERPPLSLEAG